MPFCANCGAQNTDEARFCVSCGSPLEPAQPADEYPPSAADQPRQPEPSPGNQQIPVPPAPPAPPAFQGSASAPPSAPNQTQPQYGGYTSPPIAPTKYKKGMGLGGVIAIIVGSVAIIAAGIFLLPKVLPGGYPTQTPLQSPMQEEDAASPSATGLADNVTASPDTTQTAEPETTNETASGLSGDGTGAVSLAGNISNGGLMAGNGNILFFCSPELDGIYSCLPDGSSLNLISNDTPIFMTIYEDWLYYIDYDYNDYTGDICRIHFDGSGKEIVAPDVGAYMHIEDGIIYYAVANDDTDLILYQMYVGGEGKEPVLLSNGGMILPYDSSNNSPQILIDHGTVYYCTYDDELFAVDLATRTQRLIIDGDWCQYMHVYDGYLYYLEYYSDSVYKIKLDGTDHVLLLADEARGVNMSGARIIVSSLSGDGVFSMDLNGGDIVQIGTEDSSVIFVFGDSIYYYWIDPDSYDAHISMVNPSTQEYEYII